MLYAIISVVIILIGEYMDNLNGEINKNSKCKLILFSDLHYALKNQIEPGSSAGKRKLVHYSEPLIDKLIHKINTSIHPDIVINLGDLIEDCCNHDKDIINLKYIWNILKKIESPFYSITGNHDLRNMHSRKEVEEIMGYNHSAFSKNINGYHFVFLGLDINSNLGNAEGGIIKTHFISNDDLEWLRNDLKQNKLPSLVFVHFGVAEDTLEGNWWFENCPDYALLGNRRKLKEILKKDNNLLAVFSGHQHWSKKIIEDNITYYIIGSLTENINMNGIPDGVYFEIDLDKKNLTVNEHHLKL